MRPRAVTAADTRHALPLVRLLICVQVARHGVQGHTIHCPRSDRARAMVCRHSSCGRRNGREGGHRITGRRRIASSRHHKRLAEKALHAKTKFKLIPSPRLPHDPCSRRSPRLPHDPCSRRSPRLPHDPCSRRSPCLPHDPYSRRSPCLPHDPKPLTAASTQERRVNIRHVSRENAASFSLALNDCTAHFRSYSGSLAILAAIRRASSFVSSLAADRAGVSVVSKTLVDFRDPASLRKRSHFTLGGSHAR